MKVIRSNFSVHQEAVDVTSMIGDPDPNWKFTDALGHYHFATVANVNNQNVITYPTLNWESRMTVDEDGEEWDDGFWTCAKCGWTIVPGRLAPKSGKVAGLAQVVGEFESDELPDISSEIDLKRLTGGKFKGRAILIESSEEWRTDGRKFFAKFKSIGKVEAIK